MTDSGFSSSAMNEVASILAAGLLRLQSRKSSPNSGLEAESSLDCVAQSSGDVACRNENFPL